MHPEMFAFFFETTLPTYKMYNRNDQSSLSNKVFIVFRSWRPLINQLWDTIPRNQSKSDKLTMGD